MRTGFRKKVTAILAAGALTLTGAAPLTASAAYVDVERGNWEEFADLYGELWDEALADYQESGSSSGELRLELGDYARAMLSSIFTTTDGEPMDFSWLESIGLRLAAANEESNIVETAIGLCLNDTVLATLEVPVDFGDDTVRFRVPEISGSYLGAPLEFETEEERQQWQRLKEVMNPEFLLELAADGDEVAELLKRYGDILFDHMKDSASEEKTETLANLEQTFTVEEGRLYATDLAQVMLEMAKQARDDEQLKEMIENLGTFSQQETIYEEYQQAMDEVIRDMEEDMSHLDKFEEEDYILARVWLDADGKCAGREFSIISDGVQGGQFAWLNVREGDQAALRAYFIEGEGQTEGSVFLTGSGTITDDRLNGTYLVTQSGLAQCQIEVSDYDVDAEPGDLDGTYRLTYAGETDASQEQATFPVEDFALIVDVESRAKEKIDNISLSVTMDDEVLATLYLESEEGAALLPESAAGEGTIYQADNQEDLQKYVAEVNPEAIIENCRKAGVPDEFIEQVAGLITQMMQPSDTGSSEVSESPAVTPEASESQAAASVVS